MLRLWLNALARRLFPARRRPYLILPSRPRLETLEVRLVPTTNTFTNFHSNGLWTDAANWDQNHVPTSAEDVNIPVSFTVTNTGTTTVNSLSLSGTLNLSGTLTLNSASTINTTGTLTATSTSTVNGNASLADNGNITTNQAGIDITIATTGTFKIGRAHV